MGWDWPWTKKKNPNYKKDIDLPKERDPWEPSQEKTDRAVAQALGKAIEPEKKEKKAFDNISDYVKRRNQLLK